LPKSKPLVIKGWNVFGHTLFINQLEELMAQVESLRRKDPANYTKKNATKRLAAIVKLTFEIIPQDPTLADYRLGTTLGDTHKHWFRAKFFQQYRLFFRYHSKSKVIVFAWVNDEGTKRKYNSKTDAYRTFKKMLNNGHPPDDWDKLVKESESETTRLKELVPDTKSPKS